MPPAPDRKCPRCGEVKLYSGGKNTHCKKCSLALKRQKKADREPTEEEIAAEKLDAIEESLGAEEVSTPTYEALIDDLYKIWKKGRMPDNTLAPQSLQVQALKLLERHLVKDAVKDELCIRLVLDAHIRCSECGRKMPADPRVTPGEIENMFGEEKVDEEGNESAVS